MEMDCLVKILHLPLQELQDFLKCYYFSLIHRFVHLLEGLDYLFLVRQILHLLFQSLEMDHLNFRLEILVQGLQEQILQEYFQRHQFYYYYFQKNDKLYNTFLCVKYIFLNPTIYVGIKRKLL